jgi:hypothetical protein
MGLDSCREIGKEWRTTPSVDRAQLAAAWCRLSFNTLALYVAICGVSAFLTPTPATKSSRMAVRWQFDVRNACQRIQVQL